jgi:membrane protein DedA with SNARE-associated domain
VDGWVTGTVESMGYVGVALLMALESIFPPIPSELIMPLAGYVAARGDLRIWVVIAAGTVGAVVGTLPWYGLARWLDRDGVHRFVDRHGHWLTIDCDELERAERWFDKHGRWMVAVGRLIPGVRTVVSVPAGYCSMPLGEYLGFSTLGTGATTHAGPPDSSHPGTMDFANLTTMPPAPSPHLSRDELIVLAAAAREIMRADGEVSEGESEIVSSLGRRFGLGIDEWNALWAEAARRLPSLARVKGAAEAIRSLEAREAVYVALYEVATDGTIVDAEWDLLEWLDEAWRLADAESPPHDASS